MIPGQSAGLQFEIRLWRRIEVARVVVSQFVTVDGVIEDPGGSEGFDRGGWAFQFNRGDDGDRFKLDEVMAADALLLGRVTYEGFAAAWPTRTGEFADKFNGMAKYVVSTTMDEAEWNNSTVIKGDVAEAVSKLKQEPGGDILLNGSARLVRALVEHDLIDEYRLMVFPVVLGSGKRLFGDVSEAKAMRLVESKPVGPDGVVILIYQPAAKEAKGSGPAT
jgi:dihydrofolate reductase